MAKRNMPKTRQLTVFGQWLKDARIKSGKGGKEKIQELIKKETNGFDLSPAMLGQYETGRIADPHPLVLYALAKIYEADYLEMICIYIREKYNPDHPAKVKPEESWDISEDNIESKRWDGIHTLIHQQKEDINRLHEQYQKEWTPSDKIKMAKLLVESRNDALSDFSPVLNVKAIGEWQRASHFSNLSEFWVITPMYLDEREESLPPIVGENVVQHDVNYIYLIPSSLRRSFDALKSIIEKSAPKKNQKKVRDNIRAYALDSENTASPQTQFLRAWVGTYMIAVSYPKNGKTEVVGYSCLRRGACAVQAVMMNNADTWKLLNDARTLQYPNNRIDDH